MPEGAQNFLCFVGGWGRLGSTEALSLKPSQTRVELHLGVGGGSGGGKNMGGEQQESEFKTPRKQGDWRGRGGRVARGSALWEHGPGTALQEP